MTDPGDHSDSKRAADTTGATSTTLLEMVKAGDALAWERLVFVYTPLVRWWCRQQGIAQHIETCLDCLATLQELNDRDDPLLGELRTPVPSGLFAAEDRGPIAAPPLPGEAGVAEHGGGAPPAGPIQRTLILRMAAGYAIYGSHKISVLRQAALEARKLGQYQLKRRLGAGGMGEVYLAEHVLLKRPCALKLIRPERAGDPQQLRRFEREVRATAVLTHPNTVEVLDYGHADDGTFYYVMEYLPGLSLEDMVKRYGAMPPERAVHLLRQVCGALREAHGLGLIHRDIKPGNVFVCERGGQHDVAKLVDFGLVRTHGWDQDEGKLTQEGFLAGTPAYASPEQAAGTADLDSRSDLYSLGAVAYFLLLGQPPFVRQTAVQTLAAHINDAVVAPECHRPDLPADLQAVVLRCLEKTPARRFQDADSLEQAQAQCQCADRWTQEKASVWWREHGGEKSAMPDRQQGRQGAACPASASIRLTSGRPTERMAGTSPSA